MNLLSVDWDFFFWMPEGVRTPVSAEDLFLYDWGHRENRVFAEMLWPIRAGAFLRRGRELPGTTGVERRFWRQLRLSPGASLYVADSHAYGAHQEVLDDIDTVWNFDAHHDCGYVDEDALLWQAEQGEIDAGSWGFFAHWAYGVEVHQRYPRWKDRVRGGERPPDWLASVGHANTLRTVPEIDRVFICRSSAWTPPWLDDQFWNFVTTCPAPIVRMWDGPSVISSSRPWDMALAEEWADAERRVVT